MAELIEKDLSYTIVGILFEAYNQLGGGYQEKYYQKAISGELRNRNIKFKEQIAVPLAFKDVPIGRYFLDFLIEDRIILEIKASDKFYERDIKQVLAYLKRTNIPLAILANFNRHTLQFKRILKGSSI